MKKRNGHRLLAALIAVGMCSSMQITLPQKSAAAVAVETTVQNQGLRSDPAYIRGSKAIVTYDAARQSDVLSLDGDGFGEGWLQLPALFETGCSAGFTFSMKVMLDAEADNYSKLFQFSSLPFGTGNAPAYSSPDISVDLNDKTGFRASIFAGNRQNTVNDNCHRAIFPLSVQSDAQALCGIALISHQSALNITVVASIPLVSGSSHPLSQSALITSEGSTNISPGATFSA